MAKRTSALEDTHRELGAGLAEWNDMEVAWSYASNPEKEHDAIRDAAGLFDLSGLKKIWVKGPDASAVIDKVSTREMSKITKGKAVYSPILTDEGTICDDVIIYRIDDDKYLFVYGTGTGDDKSKPVFDDDGKLVKSRWISQVKYLDDEGAIEVAFTPAVVKGISRIDGAEDFFTSYLLEQTTSMTSNYSVRLYELLVQWKKRKHTPVFELEKFRQQLGLGVDDYERMGDFKKRVLDLAVDEINKKSDLKVSYEQKKKGRKIVGFEFKVVTKNKPKQAKQDDNGRDENTPDLFHQLTDRQVNWFGAKLANDRAFGSKYAKQGEDIKAFEYRIKQELKDPDNQQKWSEHLKRVGYNPVNKKD